MGLCLYVARALVLLAAVSLAIVHFSEPALP